LILRFSDALFCCSRHAVVKYCPSQKNDLILNTNNKFGTIPKEMDFGKKNQSGMSGSRPPGAPGRSCRSAEDLLPVICGVKGDDE
jgi:hypothetical protein